MFDLVHLVDTIGYIGLFVIIFLECGVPLAFFLPGDSLLFTTGFLASQGHLSLFVLIPILFFAAVIGYILNYAIGKKIGERLFTDEHSRWFNPKRVAYAKAFFDKYGPKTIVLGRFVPIVRTFAPAIAGAVGMDHRKFVTYTTIGAIVWAIGVTLLGYYLGQMIPNADKYLLPIIVGIIVVSLVPPVYEYALHHIKNRKIYK